MNKFYRILSLVVFLMPVFIACNDWLDVTSKTEIPSDVHFSSETGFKDAVIGIYVKMSKPELYGKTLSWHVNEFVSQNYAVVSSAPDLNVPKYLYKEYPWVSYRDSIWKNCYETIANINNILNYEEKNRAIIAPVVDSLVRGELLGLRAYLHYDLLRMFGKGNLEKYPELMEELTIPYSLDFNKFAPKQVTNSQYLKYLKYDIEEAISYLRADPCTGRSDFEYYKRYVDNSFLSVNSYRGEIIDRQFRMNYYAAKALYARVLMWEGTAEAKAKALNVAENLIAEGHYRWASENTVIVQNGEWWKKDLQFSGEHLFTMAVEKLAEYQKCLAGSGNWFDASSPNNTYSVVYLDRAKVEEIYETPGIGDTDWRHIYCLYPQGAYLNNYSLVKLRQYSVHEASYSRMIPMIRISEMFYIAAECRMEKGKNYNREKALEYLNEVRMHRGIAEGDRLTSTLSDEEIQNEILKEYRKEFVGEGQVFFYYKRKGMTTIPGYNGVMTDLEYQYPMPDDEIILGGRVE